jgi:hypothetical protein
MMPVIGVLAHDQLMNQHHKFHTVCTKYSLKDIIRVIIVSLQILNECSFGESKLTIRCL